MLRIHASFHKCLTTYFIRVMDTLYNRIKPGAKGYRHYESIEGVFYNNVERYTVNSVNGFAMKIEHLKEDHCNSRVISNETQR